jgi:hypothetical protein
MDIKDAFVNVDMLFLVAEPETKCWLFGVNTSGAVSEIMKGSIVKPASW